jgi:hypothetical protein
MPKQIGSGRSRDGRLEAQVSWDDSIYRVVVTETQAPKRQWLFQGNGTQLERGAEFRGHSDIKAHIVWDNGHGFFFILATVEGDPGRSITVRAGS